MSGSLAIVTGAAGGIGNHLVEELLSRGWSVKGFDNLSSGTRKNLERFEKNPKFTFVEGDVVDLPSVRKAMDGVDYVWHLAANPDIRKGTVETDLDLKQGPIATRNILEAMRERGIRDIAFSSSSVVYGFPKVFPTPEDYGPLIPESLYGASKLACEGYLTAFAATFGMRTWIFRFANVVGPGATHGVIYDFIQKIRRDPGRLEILGDGKQKKGYMWVTDCVKAMVHCTEKSSEMANIFNLASGDGMQVSDIGKMVVERMGGKARIEYTGGSKGWPGDIPQQALSIEKLKATGFKCQYNSKQTVSMSIDVLLKE